LPDQNHVWSLGHHAAVCPSPVEVQQHRMPTAAERRKDKIQNVPRFGYDSHRPNASAQKVSRTIHYTTKKAAIYLDVVD
jgi:hypothetical protein